jgi:kynureninase
MDIHSLYRSPNGLAHHYSRFGVTERLLLTGHSHQAWPNVGFDGQQQAWRDAAEHLDEKWDLAFQRAASVRKGWRRVLDDPSGHIALAPNTHDVIVRFLSALPIRERPRIVTTDGEFHTIRRQLQRLEEEGLEVVRVPSHPVDPVADQLSRAVDGRTSAVLVSSVLFRNAHIVPDLDRVAESCRRHGALLLIDAYHSLNVVPFSLAETGLEDVYVVGGGYKYCQLGEGNCFLRIPAESRLRPAITGWFSEFTALADDDARPHAGAGAGTSGGSGVAYGQGPDRFAGSTYDPTSHYRASEVFDFFDRQGLTPVLLRQVSQHQVRLLADRFDALDADPGVITRDRSVPVEGLGGFLALRAPNADRVAGHLRDRGVRTDFRGDLLRLGPAPYLCDDQLVAAVDALADALEVMATA